MDAIPAEFATAAALFPPTVKQLLVDGCNPEDIRSSELLSELRITTLREARVLQRKAVLTSAHCKRLRDLVAKNEQTNVDTVDGGPDHQLNISRSQLVDAVGEDAAALICEGLPREFDEDLVRRQRAPPRCEIFLRRYTGATRPWIPFHNDNAAITVNIALNADDQHGGGRLIAAMGERVCTLGREEGAATVHDSRLLHAVSRISRGARCSLIVFVGEKPKGATAEERAEEEFAAGRIAARGSAARALRRAERPRGAERCLGRAREESVPRRRRARRRRTRRCPPRARVAAAREDPARAAACLMPRRRRVRRRRRGCGGQGGGGSRVRRG